MNLNKRINKEELKNSKYWIGPLLAGFFWAIGHGLTHRVIMLQENWHEYSTQKFAKSKPLPKGLASSIIFFRTACENQKNTGAPNQILTRNAQSLEKTTIKEKSKKTSRKQLATQEEKILKKFSSVAQKKEAEFISAIEALNSYIDNRVNPRQPPRQSILLPPSIKNDSFSNEEEVLSLESLNILFGKLKDP